MKIEFIADGAPECPLVRLFDYVPHEVKALRNACRDLADGRISEYALYEQPWVEPVDRCRLLWRRGLLDRGVALPMIDEPLVLEYSREAWLEVEDKLAQLENQLNKFNWLSDEGDVAVLIAQTGQW